MAVKCKTYVLKNEKMFVKRNICSKKLLTSKCLFDIINLKHMFGLSFYKILLSKTSDDLGSYYNW